MRQNNPCAMILGGFFLIPLGCYLTWKNEANQVCTTGAYQVASENTYEMGETCSISEEQNDLFLHLTCPVDQESLVTTESSTGISAKGAYKLSFLTQQYGYVQSYQTQKKCKTIVDVYGQPRDVCSDEESESCSCFDLQWTTMPVSSATFSSATLCRSCIHDKYRTPPKDQEWGSTPATKIGNFNFYADQVPLGDGTLKIDGSDIPEINNKPLLPAPKSPITIETNSFKIVDSLLCGEGEAVTCYYSTNMRESITMDTNTPHLGDLRMKVKAYGSKQISALGKEVQTNEKIATIKAASFGGSTVPPCKPRSLFYLTDGKHDSDELYEILQTSLNAQTVIFRIITMLVVGLGFHLSFSPLKNSVEAVPVIGICCGPLIEYVMHLLTVLATLILWTAVFAIAWIFYRPFFGASILLLVGLVCSGIAYVFKKGKYGELSNSDEAQIEMDSMKPNTDKEMV